MAHFFQDGTKVKTYPEINHLLFDTENISALEYIDYFGFRF